MALPSAEDEISDNELDERHIGDDPEDSDDFLADFPDDTEVRSCSPEPDGRHAGHGTLGIRFGSFTPQRPR